MSVEHYSENKPAVSFIFVTSHLPSRPVINLFLCFCPRRCCCSPSKQPSPSIYPKQTAVATASDAKLTSFDIFLEKANSRVLSKAKCKCSVFWVFLIRAITVMERSLRRLASLNLDLVFLDLVVYRSSSSRCFVMLLRHNWVGYRCSGAPKLLLFK